MQTSNPDFRPFVRLPAPSKILFDLSFLDILDPQLRRNGTPIVILHYRITNIDALSRPHILIERGLLESNGGNRGIGLLSLHQIHLQVLMLRSHQTGAPSIADPTCQEYRSVILRSERLKTVKRCTKLGRNITE